MSKSDVIKFRLLYSWKNLVCGVIRSFLANLDIELINPVIVETSGSQTGYEACLSVPGVKGIVTRPNYVKVEALNRKGEKFTVDGTELLARAFCHEIDHLDGILYVDHVEGELQSSYEDFEGEEE